MQVGLEVVTDTCLSIFRNNFQMILTEFVHQEIGEEHDFGKT